MKDDLKSHISLAILNAGKNIEDVSSFGLINSAHGQWTLKIYWKKKTLKGQKKEINIELDHSINTMILTAEVMLELKENSSKKTMTFNKKPTQDKEEKW